MTGDVLLSDSDPGAASAAYAGAEDATANGLETASNRTDFVSHLKPPAAPDAAGFKTPAAALQGDSQGQDGFKPDAGQADAQAAVGAVDPLYLGQADPAEMLYQQAETQAMVSEYRGKHPELVPFEHYILEDAALLYERAQTQGKAISDRQAVETAIAQFKAKLGAANPPAANQGQAMKRVAMRLDVSGSQPKTLPNAEAIWNMSSDEFANFERQVNQNLYS